jgi:hypothetical protein
LNPFFGLSMAYPSESAHTRSRPTRAARCCWITHPHKGAIAAFTRSLSQALVERGIRVKALALGPI